MAEPEIAGRAPVVMTLEAGTYYWCACGRSAHQPFCDESHVGTGIEPVEVKLAEARKVAICLCKRTATQPFCDGAHKALRQG
jgi:CDGSH-type Zn-finger protein